MREGQIVQVGTPDELWAHPADEDTARFLGLGNVREGTDDPARSRRACTEADRRAEMAWSRPSRDAAPPSALVVALDTGEILEAAVSGLDHPSPGDRVRVTIDERGIVPLDRSEKSP